MTTKTDSASTPIWTLPQISDDPSVYVVGCGGTGGFVAEGLLRALPKTHLMLIDFDIVEPHNLGRQAFYPGDVGKPKAQALAERLSRQFQTEVEYVTQPFSVQMWASVTHTYNHDRIIIGCVDNAMARGAIRAVYTDKSSGEVGGAQGWQPWWIDAGNAEHSGQVRIGNAEKGFSNSFQAVDGVVSRLPLPTVQEPALRQPAPPPVLDCAQAIDAGYQSPTINQVMATTVVDAVVRMTEGRLTWMAAFVDQELGYFRTYDLDPDAIARMTGLQTKSLINKDPVTHRRTMWPLCPECRRRHEPHQEEDHAQQDDHNATADGDGGRQRDAGDLGGERRQARR